MLDMQVLLIDDNPIDLLINDKVLKTLNPSLQVEKKISGIEALEYLRSLPADGEVPDFILLDIKMPIMSGFEFLEELNKLEIPHKSEIKVIMVSSSIDPNDREKAFDNPLVYDFLEKPLSLEKVKNCTSLKLSS